MWLVVVQSNGATPCHVAAQYDKQGSLQLLIDKGADKNKPNVTSLPPPHLPPPNHPHTPQIHPVLYIQKTDDVLSLELNHKNEPGDILLIVGR